MEAALTAAFANVDIYQRDPLLEDYDRSKLNLFCYPEKTEPNDQPFVAEFRTYEMNVVARFIVDGRANSATAQDVVTVQKANIADSLREALANNLPSQANNIANIYHVDFVDEDLNFQEEGVPYEEINAVEYSIRQVWAYHTYETSSSYPGGDYLLAEDGSTYLVAEDGITKLTAEV
jgi:hypothetical protein